MIRILDKVLIFVRLHQNRHFIKDVSIMRALRFSNSLHINDLSHNVKQFKLILRDFLYSHPFYTLDEYFNYNSI